MIKPYVGKERNGGEAMPISTIVMTLAPFVHEDDDLRAQVETRLCARPSNSEILKNINTQLNSLSINFSRVRLTKIPGRTGASSHSRKEKKSIRDSETLWFNKRHPR